MPIYGVISFLGYMVLVPLQNWIYQKLGKWTFLLEVLVIALFNLVVLMGNYFYYKSGMVNGDYSFIQFTFEIYYPIFLILLPILLFSRWFLNRKRVNLNTEKIVLIGDSKLDILQINLSDLICISSADNYVEISYLLNNTLHKKLLRITLKNIHPQVPSLVKTHRSYLINTTHFKDWKNANTIRVAQMEIPVSKNYKKDVLAIHNHSSLKASNSPQFH